MKNIPLIHNKKAKNSSRSKSFIRRFVSFRLLAVVFALAVAGIGTYTTLDTYAATPVVKGINSDIDWGISRSEVDKTIIQMKDAGVKWVRINANWKDMQYEGRDQYAPWYISQTDYAVSSARAAGIEVLMMVGGPVPYWASGDPAKYSDASGLHWNNMWRPANYNDYATYFAWVANRYKSQGVHTYEVGNEPDHPTYWPSGVNAAEYTQMLAATYPRLKQADPAAVVLSAGLSKNDYTYLQAMYNAGARQYFDVLGLHVYTSGTSPTNCWNQPETGRKGYYAFCGISEMRTTLNNNGDSAKKIWITEFGWTTCACQYGVSEQQQADYLTQAYTQLETNYPYVEKAFWFSFKNNYWANNDPSDYEANFGLMKTDYTKKPAYAAYKAYGGTTTAPADTIPPVATISTPKNGSYILTNTTTISASATDGIGVKKMELLIDGKLVKTVTTASLSHSWDTRKISKTKHTIVVKAYDAAGNVGSATVSVTRL